MGEVAADSFDVEVDERLGAFCGLEEGNVVMVVHEEVLCEDGRAAGVPEDVEVFLEIGVSVGGVFSDAVARQLVLRCFIEAGGQGVGLCLPGRRKAAPAAGVFPFFAAAGGIDMDGSQEDLVDAELLTDLVDPAAALLQGDVFSLRNQELDVEAQGEQLLPDAKGKVAVVGVFTEVPVGAAFARGVDAVAIVEEDFHSSQCLKFRAQNEKKMWKSTERKNKFPFQIILPIATR